MSSDQPPEVMGAGQFLKRLGAYLRPYWKESIAVIVLMAVDTAFALAFSLCFKFLIDDALPKHDLTLVTIMIVSLSFGWILASLAAVGRDFLYSRLGTFVVNDVRLQIFNHLQKLSMNFFARSQVGDLMSRFTSDLDRLENVIVNTLPSGIWGLLSVVMSMSVLLIFEWKMALLSLMSLPLCVIGPWFLGKRASSQTYSVQETTAAVSNTVQENLSAQPVVKAFGLQAALSAQFAQQLKLLSTLASKANFMGNLTQRTPSLGLSLFSVVAISAGALMAFHGYLTPGELVAMQGVLLGLSQSISDVADCYPQLVQAAAGMQRIDDILLEVPQINDSSTADVMPRPSRQIEFRGVNFGYTDEKLNLLDVSFRVPVNTLNAFVGPSGSGKSTILNLVTRFYEAGSGTVTIDDVDVRSVTQLSLRSHMSVVFQESFLFNTSVRENIRVGRPEATDSEVEAAARAAEIHDIVLAMPQGYDTLAGERGSRFSGGQRQRIAIARALLRDPAILVLDEATSALDPVTEDQINETLLRLAKGRTVLSVTHRLSPVAQYDRIFVLKDGRVVEQGPHAELLQQNGVYAGLWNKQSGFTISKEGDHVDVTVERLRAIPILSKLDPDLLKDLVSDFITDRIPHDRIVVQQGDLADKFYIIVRGQVGVSIRNDDGTERKLTTLQDGDYFGEIALLRTVPRTATVRTNGECIFLTLPREKFSKLLERAPEFRELLSRDYPA